MVDEAPLPLFPDAPRTPPLRVASVGELEDAIASAIRSGVGAALSREADLLLSEACARLIADRLLLRGFVVALPTEEPRRACMPGERSAARPERSGVRSEIDQARSPPS